ncbi:hypothetical protein PMG71_15740 [Roseofilum sp. BLCC_M154]|uniref:Uncharacterized protein n=1 Tax=Roseofilum acuticapitatum BLCC-M154 TaxID=3022444 RepID=A0ABT7AX89_9CYAN|nr:hypothetical protein [Roseofilum acuticapitatum]MDJ1170886.1 hypothetical protein [Roseofilum acuticapitatum BLCC-M154]
MKIRRKRTLQEPVQPKTQLPKSRPWVNRSPQAIAQSEPSVTPTVQSLPVNTGELLGGVSTLAPQKNLYRSPAPPEKPGASLYPKHLPRRDRTISPPHNSPLLSRSRRSPQPQSSTPPKHHLNWGHLSSPLQRQPDNSPLPTPWKPTHLLQRQSLIQRKDDPPGGTTPPTPAPPTHPAPLPPNQQDSEQQNRPQPPSHKAPDTPDKIQLQQLIAELNQAQSQFLAEKTQKEKTLSSLLTPIDNWIERKAGQSGYSDIFYIYKNQGPLQRAMILSQLGVSNFSLDEAKSNLKSRQLSKLGRKGFNWAKFSDALQTVRAVNPWDDTFIQDMSELGGAVAAVGSASVSQMANLVGGQAVADWSSEVASLLGVVGLLITAYREYTELLADNDLALYKTRVGKLGSTLADIGRYTSTGLVTLSNAVEKTGILNTLGSGLSTAAATSAAGAFAIVGGAINIGVGVGQYRQAAKNKQELEAIGSRDDLHSDLTKGAKLGAENQGWDKKAGAAKVLKGTAMILGGALLLAGLGPAGWIALAVAGVIGGTIALAKYFAWLKRKTDFVDEELGVNERYHRQTGRSVKTGFMATKLGLSKQEKGRDQIRNDTLKQQGFVSADQYYFYRLNQMAGTILEKAQAEMQVLQQRDDLQADTAKKDKTKLRDYLQANDLDPKQYPGLCILIGLGLKLTVKRIVNNRLPKPSNVVTQLDYSK